jgi:hypothetical protein
LWWLGETESSLRQLERAYAAFRRRPDPEQALLAAFWLCLSYRMSLGNHAASGDLLAPPQEIMRPRILWRVLRGKRRKPPAATSQPSTRSPATPRDNELADDSAAVGQARIAHRELAGQGSCLITVARNGTANSSIRGA